MVKRAESSVLTQAEPTLHHWAGPLLSRAYWSKSVLYSAILVGVLSLLAGCRQRLPDCVIGNAAPSPKKAELWSSTPPASHIDVAIDGSGSMLGLTGSPRATAAWKAMLKGINLAAASTGVPIRAARSGSGQLQPLTNISQAGEPCFFSDCGAYPSVSSSIDSLWKDALPKGPALPLKVAVSDLEVNAGEIGSLVTAIKPHVSRGAVIGVLAVKLPFDGSVYNSQGVVIHSGMSQRPIYMLATGPRSQIHEFLKDVRTKAVLGGVPAEALQITFLDEHVNQPTLKAVSVQGIPPEAISSGLPVRLGSSTYSPSGQSDYQFVRLLPRAQGVRLSSTASTTAVKGKLSDLGLAQMEAVSLPGTATTLGSEIFVKGMQLHGQQLLMELAIPSTSPGAALRATIPRGQLPEDWWISWDRRDPASPNSKDQTDGLLLLMTSLGAQLVEPGSTPAAAFCLAFSK